MTEYACSVCDYTSIKKDHVITHFKKKKSCGPGTKTIIEKPVDIICKYCNKNYASTINLKRHMADSCKMKDKILKEEIRNLREELKIERSRATTTTNSHNHNHTNSHNNIDNSVKNIIIVVNNYEDTSLEKITDSVLNSLIINSEESYNIIPNLIKKIHFDEDNPENHNVYLSNKSRNNKHLHVFKDGQWEITNKDTEIENLINDKENNISDWIIKKGKLYPEAAEKFNEYLDNKYDKEIANLVKEEVNLLLYNKRNMISKNNKS